MPQKADQVDRRPKEADMPPIIVDTREQLPYAFSNRQMIRRGLKTGDYSVEGLENVVAVERKELGDFINCCTHGRDRFDRELDRSLGMRRLWVVIEGSLDAIGSWKYRSLVDPHCVIGSIIAWENRHDAVRIILAGSRTLAQEITEKVLVRAWLDHAAGRTL